MIVADAMTSPVFSVGPDIPIADAIKLMLDRHFSGLPVVSADGTLLGVVSEGDFLRRHELDTERKRSWLLEFLASPGKMADEYVQSHGRRVEDVMTVKLITVGPEATLREAVDIMSRRQVKRLPVVSDGKLVGILTRRDVLRALSGTLPQGQGAGDDSTIQRSVLDELARQPWGANGAIRVHVEAGKVTLSGTIVDDRQRFAARVAAENVPGVTSVTDELIWIEPLSGVTLPPPEDERVKAG